MSEPSLYHIGTDGPQYAGPEGLTILRVPASGAAETAPQAVAEDWAMEPGPPYRGLISIEWPAPAGSSPYACMLGRGVKIADAVTGRLITTCSEVTVHADAGALVTADLMLFTDEDGEPLLEGKPVLGDGGFRTDVFPFVVAVMRVRER